jgi:hypothetical protein
MGRKRALAWLVGGVALMVGCAHRVRPGGQARTDLAYLYGRFFTKGPNSVAFVLRCQNDENKYVLKSIDRPDVQVLELAPKRCWLVEAVMESSGQHPPGLPVLKRGEVGKRIAIEPPIQRPLDFAGGHAYYLGDAQSRQRRGRRARRAADVTGADRARRAVHQAQLRLARRMRGGLSDGTMPAIPGRERPGRRVRHPLQH